MPTLTRGPVMGLDIIAYRGDTFECWARIKRNGVEVQMSGPALLLQIKAGSNVIGEIKGGSADPENGIFVDSPDGGVLRLAISASVMETFPPGVYTYDLQQGVSQNVKTWFRGSFTVIEDISKYPS